MRGYLSWVWISRISRGQLKNFHLSEILLIQTYYNNIIIFIMPSYMYLQQSIYIIYYYTRKDGRFRNAENLEIVLTFDLNNFDKRNDFNEGFLYT